MTAFDPAARVHIVGVGGAGMSGLARLLAERGVAVSGSDAAASKVLDDLARAGVTVHVGHDEANVRGADVVVWSPAVRLDNVELAAARGAGATLLTRGEALAGLGELARVVGLAGTHGKTTATSMLVHVMAASGRDCARLLGADVLGVGPNGHWGADDLLLEVDESYGTFALLNPYGLGLLNVEADHLDFYGSLEALEDAFTHLVDRTTGPAVAWVDDVGASRVARGASRGVVGVGTGAHVDWSVSQAQVSRRGSTFTLTGPDARLELALAVTGLHNVADAAVVAVLALALDVAPAAVAEGLASFQGAPRRFQLLGSWGGVDVYESYAHLPTEIRAILASARAAGYERVTAVFQPHRVTRTVSLASDFASAFEDADRVIVTDVYTAGEPNPDGVTGEVIADGVRRHHGDSATWYCASLGDLAEFLEPFRVQSDVIILLGAGDVASVAAHLRGGLS